MSEKEDKTLRANKILSDSGVTWVQCQFTDLDGKIRSFTVPASDFLNGKLWVDGMTFDGSSVGFARTENSDLRAIPDPDTLMVLPYGEGVQKVTRVITDTFTPDGSSPSPVDPRNAAKRTAQHIIDIGMERAHLQPELEFFLLREGVDPACVGHQTDPIYRIRPKGGYFAAVPWDNSDEFRNEFTGNLLKAGVDIKFHHHEGGADQIEVEFKHVDDIVKCGDVSMLYKLLSRLTAKQYGYNVSYMPKISRIDSGNGMHVHMWLEGTNGSEFSDPDDEMGLSQTARYFIGGLIDHARATCLFTNPTVNSYKRLIPEFEAPVFATWGQRNRTAMVRIPGSPGSRRVGDIEVRHGDTSSNPYLAFTVLLEAGLDGVKRKIEPPRPLSEDPNKMKKSERREMGIEMLPTSLSQALEAARTDEVVERAVGKEIFNTMVERKSDEVMDFRQHVSDWEIERYLPL